MLGFNLLIGNYRYINNNPYKNFTVRKITIFSPNFLIERQEARKRKNRRNLQVYPVKLPNLLRVLTEIYSSTVLRL